MAGRDLRRRRAARGRRAHRRRRGSTLLAIRTPGTREPPLHLLEEEKLLFTGDLSCSSRPSSSIARRRHGGLSCVAARVESLDWSGCAGTGSSWPSRSARWRRSGASAEARDEGREAVRAMSSATQPSSCRSSTTTFRPTAPDGAALAHRAPVKLRSGRPREPDRGRGRWRFDKRPDPREHTARRLPRLRVATPVRQRIADPLGPARSSEM